MTDASGQRQRAEELLGRIIGIIAIQPSQREARIEWLLEYATTARQEALMEASDLIKLMPMLTAHNVAAVLDHLAREGVKG